MAQIKRMTENFGCGIIIDEPPAWDEQCLMFVVREPYPSQTTQAGIVYGKWMAGINFGLFPKSLKMVCFFRME